MGRGNLEVRTVILRRTVFLVDFLAVFLAFVDASDFFFAAEAGNFFFVEGMIVKTLKTNEVQIKVFPKFSLFILHNRDSKWPTSKIEPQQ